jgi:exopolysaccharide biosynthesis polyprenyl glycosylphosphotransferase
MTHGYEPISEVNTQELPAIPAFQTAERDVSLLVQPEVALHQSRAANSRRQALRGAMRVLSLAAGDALAAASAAIAVRMLIQGVAHWIGGVQVPYSSTTEFCASVLLALMLTGNYRRSNPGHPTLNLLIGSSLGALVVCWSNLWVNPTVEAFPVAILLSFATACSLFVVRGALTGLSSWLLPDDRRLSAAIVIASQPDTETALDPASGYRVADLVVLEGRHPDARSRELARKIRRSRAEAVIVMGDVRSAAFARVLEIGLRAGCEVLCSPPGHDLAGVRPTMARRGPYDLIQVGPPSLKGPQFFVKRFVDVVGSGLALLCAVPLGLAIALVIRLDSPGPVFFRQWRVGIGGRRFRMFKFRTMRVGAHEEKALVEHLNASGDQRSFKIRNDPRITRVGSFLREWSLDELPQFLNVIIGHMSLIGPRPLPEADVVGYEEHHFRRLGAKPGISGLWQISGRSDLMSFDEMVRIDTEYIDHWSLWLDLKILALTVPAVLRRTGAY